MMKASEIQQVLPRLREAVRDYKGNLFVGPRSITLYNYQGYKDTSPRRILDLLFPDIGAGRLEMFGLVSCLQAGIRRCDGMMVVTSGEIYLEHSDGEFVRGNTHVSEVLFPGEVE